MPAKSGKQYIESTNVAWFAGLLEGEGYFCLGKNNRGDKRARIMIAIRMTDKDIIYKVCHIFDSNIQFKRSATKTWKEVWCAEVYGSKAIELMRLIYPYMGIRRKARIDEILTYWNNYYGKESANACQISQAV